MLKWGIVGLGKIAHSFVKDLLLVDGNEVKGLASRSKSKAIDFKNEFNLSASTYESYSELFLDPMIDIVYIATPHHSHKELSIEAMSCGKHVLCEKPMAVNAADVKEMIAASKKYNVFLMEALWSRFNPAIRQVNKLVSNGAIGDVNYINVDFSHQIINANAGSRLYNMNLAGGSLLDMGIYPVFLSYLLLGMPTEIEASARYHQTGADVQTSVILKYDDAMSLVLSSFESHSDMVAKVFGTEGKIFINTRWHEAESFVIEKDGHKEMISVPKLGKGYTHEIMECQIQIEEGHIESDMWSHNDTLNLISILDEIREKIGLVYPFEKRDSK
jgi:predicted dehydrogenase